MYEPHFQRTDTLIAMIGRIEAARAVVLRAPIAAHWESQLRHEALVRSVHHSTSIEGNPLSLEEVTDLLEGREVTAHPRDKREVLNYVEVLDYIDREYQSRPEKLITGYLVSVALVGCALHPAGARCRALSVGAGGRRYSGYRRGPLPPTRVGRGAVPRG